MEEKFVVEQQEELRSILRGAYQNSMLDDFVKQLIEKTNNLHCKSQELKKEFEEKFGELFGRWDDLENFNQSPKVWQWIEDNLISKESVPAETLVVTMLTEIGEYLKNNSTDEKQAFIKLYDDFAGSIYLQDRNICSDREDEFYTGFSNLNELKEMLDASKHSV